MPGTPFVDAPLSIEIVIEGVTLGEDSMVKSVIISQSLHTYHEFEISLIAHYESLADAGYYNSHGKYLHKKIVIKGGYGMPLDSTCLQFDGIITEVANQRNSDGLVTVLRGHGLPYTMDTGPITQVFSEKSVSDTVSECLSVSGFSAEVSSIPGGDIPYSVQYRETVWDFLRRLAYSYGAWFYYDGQKLHFTLAPGQGSAKVKLSDTSNIISVETVKQSVARKVTQYDYLSESDKLLEKSFGADDDIFTGPSSLALPGQQRALTQADVNLFAESQSDSLAAQASAIVCTIIGANLTIGSIVKFVNGSEAIGNFIVIAAKHTFEDGNWITWFRGVAAAVKAMPPGPPIHFPVSEAQVGVVTKNDDPLNLGRVKVRLQWMSSEETSWLRVMAPHYGEGAKKSRGFLFVPEVADQVMVGFQHGNPDRPFVFGAMPHGKNAAVPKPAEEHHLSVKSGTTVSFIDKDSKHELHLQVDDGNLITIAVDGGKGTITLKSSKAIILKAPDIELTAEKNLKLTGGKVTISASTGAVAIAASAGDVKVEGLNVAVTAQVGATVKGNATAELSASGMTTIKGAMVMIN